MQSFLYNKLSTSKTILKTYRKKSFLLYSRFAFENRRLSEKNFLLQRSALASTVFFGEKFYREERDEKSEKPFG